MEGYCKMEGKMIALHRMFIDNINNCSVTMDKVKDDTYRYTFEFNISQAVYTIIYDVTEWYILHESLNTLYHQIRASVCYKLFEEITN